MNNKEKKKSLISRYKEKKRQIEEERIRLAEKQLLDEKLTIKAMTYLRMISSVNDDLRKIMLEEIYELKEKSDKFDEPERYIE